MRIVIIGGGPGGLYFALLAKKKWPRHEITVFERNAPDDTFGFGVVFSDETLDQFLKNDPESYESITGQFAYWDEIDFILHGEIIRSTGHGFCGCGRIELLKILQKRCENVGVRIEYSAEITNFSGIDADLVVGADGINSFVRKTFSDQFRPDIQWRKNHFVWLGSNKPYNAFTFDFTENGHGIWVLGAYQYKDNMSTWIVEAPAETWENAKSEVANLENDALVSYMEGVWADQLEHGKYQLTANKSLWRQFPTVRCENWYYDRYILIGDALHTAHYSIGSGTKLAMEDAIVLVEALENSTSVKAGQQQFEKLRREEVEKTQHAADISVIWTENPRRYWKMGPIQAAFSMLSRSKQVTYENLRLRDPLLIERVDSWFADEVRRSGLVLKHEKPPPIFTPLKLRSTVFVNRIVVSPMDMYSSIDGVPSDFHLVHLGSMALGGAGLIFSEMTCVSSHGRITPGCAGIYTDAQAEAWQKIIDFIHKNSDAKFCLQLGHAGRKGSTKVGWEGIDAPLEKDNWEVIAPSPLSHAKGMHIPREMTRADMEQVRDDFVSATCRAMDIGADMIELHMAHGYLLSSFITPVANHRNDYYGGNLKNRLRFPLQVFDAVRNVWPEHQPISVRLSATDWLEAGGITADDTVTIASIFKEHGCDIIDVSAGQTTPDAVPIYGRMFQTPFSEQIRNEAQIPTIAVGNITTADQANTIIAAGRADLIALARPHLTNPHFTLDAAAWYGHGSQRWPIQYGAAKEQALRLAEREKQETITLRKSAAPSSHRTT